MEEFDSGWDETPSSLDTESMNNYEVSETLNGYEPSILRQQVLEMRNDPEMPCLPTDAPNNAAAVENKDAPNPMDYSSLTSEIFLATRLLHDDTLDSTTLNTMAGPATSPYNDCSTHCTSDNQNYNTYLGSPLANDPHHDTVDSIGLSQQEALDSEFLYNSFEQLSSDRPDLNFDEENSNKSWTDTIPISKIMPTPVRAVSRKKTGGRKPKEERKKRIVKIVKKKPEDSTFEYSIAPAVPLNTGRTSSVTISKIKERLNNLSGITVAPLKIINKNDNNLISDNNNKDYYNYNINDIHKSINKKNSDIVDRIAALNSVSECMSPSTSGANVQTSVAHGNINNSNNNFISTKDGRKVPSYLRMFKLKDQQYPDVYACKNCYGIYTTLDSAMFHPCIKKRRGRRPKILADCEVPL